jgi:hypothetical protein
VIVSSHRHLTDFGFKCRYCNTYVNIRLTDSEELRSENYADPSTCSYLYYTCTYCLEEFQLVDPETLQAGGAIRKTHYRNRKTNKIKTTWNAKTKKEGRKLEVDF